MEILEILEESSKDLYPEDLDFFETELATGGPYTADYQAQCIDKIRELRAWLKGRAQEASEQTKDALISNGLMLGINDIAPGGNNPVAASMRPEDAIFNDIRSMRGESSYKTYFKNYVAEKDEIDAAFVDAHHAQFEPWELDAIVSVKQMGEEFLEKYFDALDHDKIARYQLFSESFFMKHFSQLNAAVVLQYGKNEWRKKEKRSKQLDVFLRLKGVKK